MTQGPKPDSEFPFGADPTRSKLPIVVWGLFYLAWLVFLFAMATRYT